MILQTYCVVSRNIIEFKMQETAKEWIEDDDGIYEYHIETKNAGNTFRVAQSACQKLGSVLAAISSKSSQDLIENLIPPIQPGSNSTRQYWIGAARTNQNSPWKWEDGRPLNYTNWYMTEANQTSRNPENCVSIFSSSFRYQWFSNHCESNHFGYICERPVGGFPSTPNLRKETSSQENANDAVASTADVVLQIVVPILVVFVLLLLVFGILYFYKQKQWKAFCKWAPLNSSPEKKKKVMNEYVDLPVGRTTGIDGTPTLLNSNPLNQDGYSEIQISGHSNEKNRTASTLSHGYSEIQIEHDDKSRSKSNLDNPTYVPIDVPPEVSSIPESIDTNDYTTLRSLVGTESRHNSTVSAVSSTSSKQQQGNCESRANNRKFWRHSYKRSGTSNPQTDVYVEVYSLSSKMKIKK